MKSLKIDLESDSKLLVIKSRLKRLPALWKSIQKSLISTPGSAEDTSRYGIIPEFLVNVSFNYSVDDALEAIQYINQTPLHRYSL